VSSPKLKPPVALSAQRHAVMALHVESMHRSDPGGHGLSLGMPHAPLPWQISPLAQRLLSGMHVPVTHLLHVPPHVPSLFETNSQLPLQAILPSLQSPIRQLSMWLGTHVDSQRPPMQAVFGPQGRLHPPQCWLLLRVSTQPPQSVRAPAHRHCPPWQDRPVPVHREPQRPQFSLLVLVSTQAFPQKSRPPEQSQEPFMQVRGLPHTAPQRPQLFASLRVSTQVLPHLVWPGQSKSHCLLRHTGVPEVEGQRSQRSPQESTLSSGLHTPVQS
jgi:hypothetical protein